MGTVVLASGCFAFSVIVFFAASGLRPRHLGHIQKVISQGNRPFIVREPAFIAAFIKRTTSELGTLGFKHAVYRMKQHQPLYRVNVSWSRLTMVCHTPTVATGE